jgi:dolichol-phosphate mannosyltransferase
VALTLELMQTLVILPTFNEVATIENVMRRSRDAVADAEILVIDDGSPDGTAILAEKVGEDIGGVHILRRNRRLGLGDAYRTGFIWGLARGFEALVEMDSDLSHNPADLVRLLAGLADNDLVIGSRYVSGGSIPQWGVHRRLLSWAGNTYSSLMLGLPVRDMTSGFRAYRAEILQAIDLTNVRANGYGFQIEMTYRAAGAGARIEEVPIQFVDREVGESKMSASTIVEALLLVTRWGVVRGASRLRVALGGWRAKARHHDESG